MKKIGILEDDEAMGKELSYYLESNGYEARWIEPAEYAGKKAEELVKLLLDEKLHLLLLDVGLPGINGLHVCKEFRKASECPVIMITSKNDDLTELMAINNGADDFVAKPFNPQILIAHMESVIKRTYKAAAVSDELRVVQEIDNGGEKRRQEFTLELSKGRVVADSAVELSKNELQILKILVENQGNIVSRDDIMNALWDNCMFVDDNTLTVNMTRLKGKLEDIGITGAIVTKRGMGYQLQ
ncbi:MAG: response regulator transcription factor [Acetatifactor sp.]|nr:response regulator transcription factor [Acetatifactor sp.]